MIGAFIYISLFLKLTVHSTYTEKLQINEQIKLYTIYTNTWSNIPRENRYCELCQKNQIGDEYHYIFECTNLSEKRTSLFPKHLILIRLS
jgi:hypothetical protein